MRDSYKSRLLKLEREIGEESAEVLATLLSRSNREGSTMRDVLAAFERDSGRNLTADFREKAERIASTVRAMADAMFATTGGGRQ